MVARGECEVLILNIDVVSLPEPGIDRREDAVTLEEKI